MFIRHKSLMCATKKTNHPLAPEKKKFSTDYSSVQTSSLRLQQGKGYVAIFRILLLRPQMQYINNASVPPVRDEICSSREDAE